MTLRKGTEFPWWTGCEGPIFESGPDQVIEVGLDFFLVEVATGIIHDVLMDVIR